MTRPGLGLELRGTWHDPGRRKLEAVKACAERDEERLGELLETYMIYRGRKGAAVSPLTLKTYKRTLHLWLLYCWPDEEKSPDVPLLRATEDDVAAFVQRYVRDSSPSTAALYLSGVRAFYRALGWAGVLKEDPAANVLTPHDPRPAHEKRPAPTMEIYMKLIRATAGGDIEARRNQVILRLFGDTGLRVSELTGANLNDVDLEDSSIFVANGKGGKVRTVDLSEEAHAALFRWLGVRRAAPGEEALLVNTSQYSGRRFGRRLSPRSVQRYLQKLFEDNQVPERYRGPHCLRHLLGTRLYDETGDIYAVMDALGHSDPKTSTIYAKMSRKKRKSAMSKISDG